MLDHKTSVAPGEGPAAGHAAATPGKQTLTQGMSAKPKATAPTAKSAAKPAAKKSEKKGKGKKGREYQTWVDQWVLVVAPAQILDMDPDGAAAGSGDSLPPGKTGQVVAEVVDGPIQVELMEEDKQTGQLRRVWIPRDDAVLILAEDAGDQMSHDPERESAIAESGTKKAIATQKALCDLGDLPSMGGNFCQTAGGLIEALVPDLGDSSKVVLRVNIPTATGGLLYFAFTGSVERDNMVNDDQYKVRLEFAAGYGMDKSGWIFKAFVEAGVFGYLEASGDTGKETFDLLTYAISRMVAKVSPAAAEAVFSGGETASSIEKKMDREDYAMVGAGVRGSAGLVAGEQKIGVSGEASAAGRYTGSGAQGKETGQVQAETIAMAQLGLNWTTEGVNFGGGASVTGGLSSMSLLAVNASATGSKSLDLAELNEMVGFEKGARVLAAYGLDALAAIGPIVAEALDKLGMNVSKKTIDDHLTKTAANLTGARMAAALATTAYAKQMTKIAGAELAVPMSYDVAIEFEWKPGTGASFAVQLKRVSAIELGVESGEAGAYAKVENATRIFKIQLNNQGFKAE